MPIELLTRLYVQRKALKQMRIKYRFVQHILYKDQYTYSKYYIIQVSMIMIPFWTDLIRYLEHNKNILFSPDKGTKTSFFGFIILHVWLKVFSGWVANNSFLSSG